MSEKQNLEEKAPADKAKVEEKALEKNNRNFLAISIITAAVIVSGTLLYVFGPKNAANITPTSLTNTNTATTLSTLPDFATSLPYPQTKVGDHIVLGNPNAPVTIEEYADYQCTFCNKFFNETELQIRQNYIASGKAKMIYKGLAIIDSYVPGGHESRDATLAASCAADQSKFWEYSDAIFTVESKEGREDSGNLTRDLFIQIADKLGMDKNQFTSCLDSQKYGSLIAADNEDAMKVFNNKIGTPSFVINGTVIVGAQPYSVFSKVIDAALAKAGSAK
jgi:protein-disulfide isomerase